MLKEYHKTWSQWQKLKQNFPKIFISENSSDISCLLMWEKKTFLIFKSTQNLLRIKEALTSIRSCIGHILWDTGDLEEVEKTLQNNQQ